MEFAEALRILAQRTGIELKSSGFHSGNFSEKEKLYAINRLVMEFYHYVLTKHKAGSMAMDYLLKQRKMDARLIETFKLGFAPKEDSSLVSYLINKKKYTKKDLVNASLGIERSGRVFDFFRGRLMFPLFDHRGNIAGFSGRAIDKDFFGGKYINSRETLTYHKGSMFFGLNMAKEAIKTKMNYLEP